MKILLLFAFAFIFVTSLAVADKCNGRCAILTECCIDYGFSGICTSKGLAGGYCGGAFYCDDCILGTFCVQRRDSYWNRFKPGTGTCQGISYSG